MGFDNSAQVLNRRYVKYVPVGYAESHSAVLGYALWLVGFTGAHRFFFGRPLTGALWFFTFGLLGVGWLIDLFLIPGLAYNASNRYRPGPFDYNIAWLLCFFLGILGFHRLYQGKFLTGILYLVSGGLFGIGWIYDLCTLNEQIDEANVHAGQTAAAFAW